MAIALREFSVLADYDTELCSLLSAKFNEGEVFNWISNNKTYQVIVIETESSSAVVRFFLREKSGHTMTTSRKRNPHQLKGCDLPTLRQQILDEQDGDCPICGLPVDAPCLDHSHKRRTKGTGLVRGVLCRSCNVLLGKIENNCTRYKVSHKALPLVLRNMACYLERPHKNILHPSERERPKKLKKSSYNLLKKRAKASGVSAKRMPDFPKSGLLTKPLEAMFLKYDLEPEYYR